MTATTSELSASLQSPMTLATNAHGVKELTYVSWSTLPPLPGKLQRLMTLNVERRRITCISMSLDLSDSSGTDPPRGAPDSAVFTVGGTAGGSSGVVP